MAAPEDALDAMLEGPAGMPAPEDDMADDGDEDDMPGDDFGMFAADFLDDTLPMGERIEALRSAILAAGSGGMLE